MTLLELLLEELPHRGGWPRGAACACQSAVDNEIYFYPDPWKDGEIPLGDAHPKFYPHNDVRTRRYGRMYVFVSKREYEKAAKNG